MNLTIVYRDKPGNLGSEERRCESLTLAAECGQDLVALTLFASLLNRPVTTRERLIEIARVMVKWEQEKNKPYEEEELT